MGKAGCKAAYLGALAAVQIDTGLYSCNAALRGGGGAAPRQFEPPGDLRGAPGVKLQAAGAAMGALSDFQLKALRTAELIIRDKHLGPA